MALVGTALGSRRSMPSAVPASPTALPSGCTAGGEEIGGCPGFAGSGMGVVGMSCASAGAAERASTAAVTGKASVRGRRPRMSRVLQASAGPVTVRPGS
ncbi:hypothetical protein SAMN05216266_104293 [Amycolatopsis marina]|uniref:Uncharacterized protein n=1 Tax=Amycolatopsis marina TaxID=490629 RepID=A0A1I0Y7S6_9PSEU|nr:hypothetical protein SAMN05216266_104293 [Amycolatopsis marina]